MLDGAYTFFEQIEFRSSWKDVYFDKNCTNFHDYFAKYIAYLDV